MSETRQRKAHKAFANRDTELSRAAHQSSELAEIAAGKSDFLHGIPPSTSFTTSPISSFLLGSMAASLTASVTDNSSWWFLAMVMLTCTLYLSSWMDELFNSDFSNFEKSRERWEVDNFPEGEIQEMLQIYTNYGISDTDAMTVATTLAKYPEFWVDHMLLHEIGILPPGIRRRQNTATDTDDDDQDTATRAFKLKVVSILAFLSAFIIPSLSVSQHKSILAVGIAHAQLMIGLYLKASKYQWLSTSTAVSILAGTIVASLSVGLIARTQFIF